MNLYSECKYILSLILYVSSSQNITLIQNDTSDNYLNLRALQKYSEELQLLLLPSGLVPKLCELGSACIFEAATHPYERLRMP